MTGVNPRVKRITVDADTRYAEMRIRQLRKLNKLTEEEITQNKQKLRELYSIGSNLMSFFLANAEQNAAVQFLQASLQVTQTQLSVASMRAEMAAAIATGNWVSAIAIGTTVSMQEYNLVRSIAAQEQSRRAREYIKSINVMREAYM